MGATCWLQSVESSGSLLAGDALAQECRLLASGAGASCPVHPLAGVGLARAEAIGAITQEHKALAYMDDDAMLALDPSYHALINFALLLIERGVRTLGALNIPKAAVEYALASVVEEHDEAAFFVADGANGD